MTFVFVTVRILPGDYAAAQVSERYFGGGAASGESPEDALNKARERLGLNDSIPVQYGKYVASLVTDDLGTSFATGRTVLAEIRHALPYTIQLGTMSLIVGVLVALPVGIISAVRQDSLLDAVLRFFAIGALAAPSFWTATIGTLLVLRYDVLELNIRGEPRHLAGSVVELPVVHHPGCRGRRFVRCACDADAALPASGCPPPGLRPDGAVQGAQGAHRHHAPRAAERADTRADGARLHLRDADQRFRDP